MLEVAGLSVHYGRIQALREVSLQVDAGEIVTLVGANGAGKTSLLNAIGGAVPISAGKVQWESHPISGLPSHKIARMGISYVPEGRQLLPTMSVLDNLLLGCYVHYVGRWRRLLSFSGSLLKDDAGAGIAGARLPALSHLEGAAATGRGNAQRRPAADARGG